jgi:hypothetical protein
VTRLEFANRVDDPKLAGRYVAFKQTVYVSEFGSASGIKVVDLKTGRTKVGEAGVPGAGGDSHVMSYVVKRNGSVAWVGMGERGEDVSVLKVDSTTDGPRLLDSGPQVDYESLSLAADRRSIGWRNGAEQKTAPLD